MRTGSRREFLWSALASQALAQDTTSQTVFRVPVNVVVAPVTVIDRDGRLVTGLEPKDFTLYDNKVEQDIKVDVSFVPISMVVAIQANDVVEPFLSNIKKIGPLLEGLVLGEQGAAAILKFDHRLTVLEDFTNDGKLFTAALNKINPGSSTSAMIDSVFEATRMLRRRPNNHRKILLLISETRDHGSEGRLREALLEAQIHNIMIYSVNINRAVTMLAKKMPPPRPQHMPPAARPMPPGAPRTPTTADQLTGYGGAAGNVVPVVVEIMKQVKSIFVDNPLEMFTEYTGGREFSFLTLKSLEETFSKLGEELHSQYLLSYSPNDKVRMMGGWHDIKVDVARFDMKVRTRPGYWMAAVPQ